jgi:2'-5' RNA ligase
MDPNPNGGAGSVPPEQRLNVYALVIYIPDPLGRFLDDLRRELVPHYNPHAHVSVLPPRPLPGDLDAALNQVAAQVAAWAPFDVELGDVEVFPVTDVLFLDIAAGAPELRRMHTAINTAALGFPEPFVYHPHVTLAQEVAHDRVATLRDLAARRWREYRGRRSFRAERAVFVQNTLENRWIDLAEVSLGGAVAIR